MYIETGLLSCRVGVSQICDLKCPVSISFNHLFNYFDSVTAGGPYAAFGGRDASRGLATFSVTASEVEYDDLTDLSTPEMDSVREWEAQFKGEL